jgi:hypothetical protein
LVYSSRGLVRISGRLVNNAVPYTNASVKTPFPGAAEAIARAYRQRVPGVPDDLDVQVKLVAIPELEEVGVLGVVRDSTSSVLANVVVEATSSSGLPRILLLQELAAPGLGDTAPVAVGTVRQDTPTFTLGQTLEQASTTLDGSPLLGSVDDFSGDIQLGTDRVVSISLEGAPFVDVRTASERLTSASGVFPETGSPEIDRQSFYQAAHAYYELVDDVLTLDTDGVITRHWDSARPFISGSGPSEILPGLYEPRIMIFTDMGGGDIGCPEDASGCVVPFGVTPNTPDAVAYPEFVHLPPLPGGELNSDDSEVIGSIRMSNGTTYSDVRLFAHEFGHALELFIAAGHPSKFSPLCPSGGCQASCQENTTEEAAPLVESIANGFAILLLHRFYDFPSASPCTFFNQYVTSGVQDGPGECLADGGSISVLRRDDPCTEPGGRCDKPTDPGFDQVCCDPSEPDCTTDTPSCPLGGSRFDPTGSCFANHGYRTASIGQAFWQVLSNLRCSPVAPFQCVEAAFSPDVDAADMLLRSWVYALKLDPGMYQELFDDMATYVGCNYDQPTFEEFNAILCTHGLMPCDQPVPVACQTCGNSVIEGGEECDGNDLTLLECADFPEFTEGELACTANCTFDTSMCEAGGVDTGSTSDGSTSDGDGSTTSSTGVADTGTSDSGTDTDSGGGGVDEGGGCRREDGHSGAWWVAFCVRPLMASRRRREGGL